MRGYFATTAREIAAFLESSSAPVGTIYAPTIKFQTANVDLDDEESEYALSLLAAEDSLELREEDKGPGFVLALEVPENAILEHGEITVTLRDDATWDLVECLFLVSEDGQDLTWFATQEIPSNLPQWLVGS
jgi:hypothetical protein